MNKRILLVSLVLMSLAAADNAIAGPGRMRLDRQAVHEQRAGREDERERERDRERERAQQNENNRPAQNPNGQSQQYGQMPGRAGESGQSGNINPAQAQQAQPQFPRAGARMSAEERQKLRRQINEAGRSIYVPPGK
ncbi:MAG TPA: hypothetical protein VIF60_08200 [Burkholderiaceae bacterium]